MWCFDGEFVVVGGEFVVFGGSLPGDEKCATVLKYFCGK
jgi:hypothetical protein